MSTVQPLSTASLSDDLWGQSKGHRWLMAGPAPDCTRLHGHSAQYQSVKYFGGHSSFQSTGLVWWLPQKDRPLTTCQKDQHDSYHPQGEPQRNSNCLFQWGSLVSKQSSHLGIHKQTNACWSIPRSQTDFYHFKICRNWELWSLCCGALLPASAINEAMS